LAQGKQISFGRKEKGIAILKKNDKESFKPGDIVITRSYSPRWQKDSTSDSHKQTVDGKGPHETYLLIKKVDYAHKNCDSMSFWLIAQIGTNIKKESQLSGYSRGKHLREVSEKLLIKRTLRVL